MDVHKTLYNTYVCERERRLYEPMCGAWWLKVPPYPSFSPKDTLHSNSNLSLFSAPFFSFESLESLCVYAFSFSQTASLILLHDSLNSLSLSGSCSIRALEWVRERKWVYGTKIELWQKSNSLRTLVSYGLCQGKTGVYKSVISIPLFCCCSCCNTHEKMFLLLWLTFSFHTILTSFSISTSQNQGLKEAHIHSHRLGRYCIITSHHYLHVYIAQMCFWKKDQQLFLVDIFQHVMSRRYVVLLLIPNHIIFRRSEWV